MIKKISLIISKLSATKIQTWSQTENLTGSHPKAT